LASTCGVNDTGTSALFHGIVLRGDLRLAGEW
jgi:hypothetical protein